MEDNLRWKTTFDGRRPLMEDDLKNKYNIKMKKIMFLSVLGLLRQRSDYCHRVAIFELFPQFVIFILDCVL